LASDGALTFGSDDRKVYRVSPAGAVLWTTLVGGAVASTPVVDRAGTVYVGANNGRVYALGAADGAVRWSFASNGPVRSALAIGVGGRLFAGSSDKSLYALGEFRGGADCWSNAFVDPNGLSPEEADRRLQTLLAACGGASISSCELQVIGAVNADRVAAAREILAEEITPAQYLALLRDRTRKLAALQQAGVISVPRPRPTPIRISCPTRGTPVPVRRDSRRRSTMAVRIRRCRELPPRSWLAGS
jgi:hypothetical protein